MASKFLQSVRDSIRMRGYSEVADLGFTKVSKQHRHHLDGRIRFLHRAGARTWSLVSCAAIICISQWYANFWPSR